jgi:hypothetical protein
MNPFRKHQPPEQLSQPDAVHSTSTSENVDETGLDIEEDLPAQTASSRRYFVFHAPNHHNLNVTTDADGQQQLYFVRNSTFMPKVPDVTLHAGADRNAPIAAVANFIHFSGDTKIGLGDPNDDPNITWEDLKKQNWKHSEYSWEMTLDDNERRTFVWKRTHHVGIDDERSSLTNRNFKLVDPHTEELLAVFASAGLLSRRKCGRFQINVDYGKRFDTLVILTALTLLEKQRRRVRHSGSGGGGGP